MKKLISIAVFSFAALLFVSFFSCSSQIPKADLKTSIDSISYAQGVLYSQEIERLFAQFELEESNKADFIKGYQQGFNIDAKDKKSIAFILGKMLGSQMGTQFVPYFNMQLFGNDSTKTMNRKDFLSGYLTVVKDEAAALMSRDDAQMYSMTAIEIIRNETMEKQYGGLKVENQEWLERNKSNEGVVVLPSGLQYKVIIEGKGVKPVVTDQVRVAYKGTTINGEVFETNESTTFPVGGVMRGWIEGLQLMPVGSKYMFYIPYDLAYGEQGAGEQIPPYSTLIFEVELFEIVK